MRAIIKASLLFALLGGTLAGCSQEKVTSDSDSAKAPESAAPQFDAAAAEAAMNRPLDGSSVEAFEEGLRQVASAVRPEDYNKVQAAISWMMFYDLSAAGDKAKLYASLDGATPWEVIARSGRKN
jgi:hypothetical protein